MAFDEPVEKVRLVSPARAKSLAKLGIHTVRDLLCHFPRRYIDLSQILSIGSATIGDQGTIVGSIHDIQLKKPKPRLVLVEITLVDGTGTLMVTCFRQPWLKDVLSPGARIAVSGKLEFGYGYKRMTNPFIEELDGHSPEEGGLVIPVHPATETISTAWMRRLIANALELVKGAYDPLPLDLRVRYLLPARSAAIRAIHFPQGTEEAETARRRLAYEELLLLELYLMTQTAARSQGRKPQAHCVDGSHSRALSANLPFTLTEEQEAARDALAHAMAAPEAANHMLLGDVGTGKTIVAAFGLAACADTGTQAIMMAPTEILARQYGRDLGPLLDLAGISWSVLTGSTTAAERDAQLARARTGEMDVLFGTHALLEDDVVLKECSFVVIDEQHRFGVGQRAKLLAKGEAPDALYLTATPIPRSLALAIYGDLTLSYLRTRPQNKAGNTTRVLRRTERGHAYDAALAALARDERVYVVCPLVGKDADTEGDAQKGSAGSTGSVASAGSAACVASAGSAASAKAFAGSPGGAGSLGKGSSHGRGGSPGGADFDQYEYASVSIESEGDFEGGDLKAAMREAAFLQSKTFIDYQVGLLHGSMSGAEKQEAMRRFREGETQVLVATTVVEVGVDVPEATVMIIEDADRFGLAQLHQLRGRVGRGTRPGEVFLVSGSKAPPALERLAAMERTDDGFELASFDLSLRREGDILGNRQHGASVLKLVNVVRDAKVIEAAHRDAADILSCDPLLEGAAYRALGREMRMVFKEARKSEGG
jgi:ATP-dependent DNA helicase RecG